MLVSCEHTYPSMDDEDLNEAYNAHFEAVLYHYPEWEWSECELQYCERELARRGVVLTSPLYPAQSFL
jgi:hypothetical protein